MYPKSKSIQKKPCPVDLLKILRNKKEKVEIIFIGLEVTEIVAYLGETSNEDQCSNLSFYFSLFMCYSDSCIL